MKNTSLKKDLLFQIVIKVKSVKILLKSSQKVRMGLLKNPENPVDFLVGSKVVNVPKNCHDKVQVKEKLEINETIRFHSKKKTFSEKNVVLYLLEDQQTDGRPMASLKINISTLLNDQMTSGSFNRKMKSYLDAKSKISYQIIITLIGKTEKTGKIATKTGSQKHQNEEQSPENQDEQLSIEPSLPSYHTSNSKKHISNFIRNPPNLEELVEKLEAPKFLAGPSGRSRSSSSNSSSRSRSFRGYKPVKTYLQDTFNQLYKTKDSSMDIQDRSDSIISHSFGYQVCPKVAIAGTYHAPEDHDHYLSKGQFAKPRSSCRSGTHSHHNSITSRFSRGLQDSQQSQYNYQSQQLQNYRSRQEAKDQEFEKQSLRSKKRKSVSKKSLLEDLRKFQLENKQLKMENSKLRSKMADLHEECRSLQLETGSLKARIVQGSSDLNSATQSNFSIAGTASFQTTPRPRNAEEVELETPEHQHYRTADSQLMKQEMRGSRRMGFEEDEDFEETISQNIPVMTKQQLPSDPKKSAPNLLSVDAHNPNSLFFNSLLQQQQQLEVQEQQQIKNKISTITIPINQKLEISNSSTLDNSKEKKMATTPDALHSKDAEESIITKGKNENAKDYEVKPQQETKSSNNTPPFLKTSTRIRLSSNTGNDLSRSSLPPLKNNQNSDQVDNLKREIEQLTDLLDARVKDHAQSNTREDKSVQIMLSNFTQQSNQSQQQKQNQDRGFEELQNKLDLQITKNQELTQEIEKIRVQQGDLEEQRLINFANSSSRKSIKDRYREFEEIAENLAAQAKNSASLKKENRSGPSNPDSNSDSLAENSLGPDTQEGESSKNHKTKNQSKESPLIEAQELKTQLNEARKKNEDLQQKIEVLKFKMESMQATQPHTKQISISREGDLEQAVPANTLEVSDFQRVEELEREVQQLRVDKKELKARIEELEGRLADLRHYQNEHFQVSSLEEQLKINNMDRDNLEKRHLLLKKELQSQNTRLEETNSELIKSKSITTGVLNLVVGLGDPVIFSKLEKVLSSYQEVS